MSWLELDDRILEHPKFIRAVKNGGSEAVHLWLGMRAYCGQLLTDGLIPVDMIDEVRGPRDPRKRSAALTALVDAGLLERCVDGSLAMHDFLQWSQSKDEIEGKRRTWRESKRRTREIPTGVHVVSTVDSSGNPSGVSLPLPARASPLPSPPLPPSPNPEGDPERVPPQARDLEPRRPYHLAAITPVFLAVFDGYPNQNSKVRAAQEFQDLAPAYGGEDAFAARLLSLFKRGFLRRHPYDGEPKFIPTLATVLAERRFEEKWTPTPSNGVPAEIPDLPPGVPRPPRPQP